MKRINLYGTGRAAAAALLALATVSCNDMLEMPSKNAYESEVVFNSVTRTEMVVTGIYPNFKSKALVNYMTPDNDETYSTLSGNERAGLAKYTFAAGSGQMKPILESRYKAINNANECIEGLEKEGVLEGESADAVWFRALYGEALALRALAYFDLIRFYGDVPFPLTPSKAGEEFNLGRTSRDVIYDRILSDLDYAATVVPWQSEVSYHDRITKGAVYGLTARIALHAAGYSLRWDLETYAVSSMRMERRSDEARIQELYEIARDACLAVMAKEDTEHGLVEDYVSIFKDLHNKGYNKENIFELGNYGTSANDEIGYSMGLAVGGDTPAGYMKSGTLVRITPGYYYSFAAGDKRRDVACAAFQIAKNTGYYDLVGLTNIACGKWRKIWSKIQGPEAAKTDINWVMLRYADILLMYAEADNELTAAPSPEAKEALRKVRRRAFPEAQWTVQVDGYVDALTTKEAFLDAIVKERSWELGSESNLRRTDLIRWNRLKTAIEDARAKINYIIDEAKNPYTGADIPKYRAYNQQAHGVGAEPLTVAFIEGGTEWETVDEDGKAALDKTKLPTGYNAGVVFRDEAALKKYAASLAKDFTENKTELMPLNQSLIDTNTALKNAQHPGFR